MRERLTFEKEMLELSIEAEAPTAISEYSFILTPVEVPGGGRIKDRTLANPANLITIKGYGGRHIQLHHLAAKAWEVLISAARSDGLSDPLLLPTSGYRSPKTQEEGWKKAIRKYGSPEEARKWVAPPGKSAHQTGRAIDFYIGGKNSSANVEKLRTLPAYKWLVKNAERFGFYPYKQEPWHWEYNPPAYSGIEKQPIPSAPSTTQSIFSLPQQLQDAVRRGLLTIEIAFAILYGERDVNKLTNLIFYARYPDMQGKKLERGDPRAQDWLRIRDNIIRPVLDKFSSTRRAPAVSSISPPVATAIEDVRLFKWHPPTKKRRYSGYSRYGGGRVNEQLKKLHVSGRLTISDADIDMLQRIANVETGGMIQGINSYDSAFMSMGFMQWTIKYTDQYNLDGKLQRLIQRVPEAFQRYKIELDTSSRYKIPAGGGKYYEPIAIKGAGKPDNLRGLDWAKRFYAAGLDPDIIVEEVKLALEVIEESKKRITKKVGNSYIPYYEKSTALRALIQETFNNRPAYLYIALQRAITRAKKTGEVNTDKFFEMVQEAIRDVYGEKEPENGPKKAGNLIQKTARI